jgi:AbiV family abortive infection protein
MPAIIFLTQTMNNVSIAIMSSVQQEYCDYLDRLAYASFKTALLFHYDSAVLLGIRSFPSAIFTSIQAQEEFGKFFLIDDLRNDIQNGRKSLNQAKNILTNKIMRDHVLKQWIFGIHMGNIPQFEKYISNPRNIQDLRNEVLYTNVNQFTGKINRPTKKATKKKALYQIRFVNCAAQDMVHEAYEHQHDNVLAEDWFDSLSDNTVSSDFMMIDEMCACVQAALPDNKILLERDLLEYFESIKLHRTEQEYKNSYKLCVAFRRYQSHKPVKKFIKF